MQRSGRERDGKPVKILHVEDNPENRMLVRALLEADGYAVVDAEDGISAVRLAMREEPALILLDINLPGIEGYEVAAILRSFPALAGVPIIAVTAYAMEGDRLRTLVAGCDGYLQKPIDVDAFPGQVADFLFGKRERVEEREAGPYLRELNQRLVYRLVGQVDELERLNAENGRLYGETQERLRQTETLLRVSQAVGSTLDLTEITRRTTREMVCALGADAGVSWQRETADGPFVVSSGYHVPLDAAARYEAAPPGLRTDFTARLARFTDTEAVENSATDTRFAHPLLDGIAHRSLLVVPMRGKDDTVIGGFLVAWTGQRHRLTEDERRLVDGIARQAAMAIENARLLAAEREARERLAASEQRYRQLSTELTTALATVEASQETIVKGERLRALGELAGGVAHDFNNTLAIIVGRADVLLAKTLDTDVRQQLGVIMSVALDAAQTVRRIQEFTRRRRSRPFQVVDLNEIVREVVEVTRSRWKDEANARNVRYDVVVDAHPLPRIAGDPSELRETLTNLVFNALDAMPCGGRLTFRTGVEEGRVLCALSDTGVGMTEDVRSRVFDPFFTTKGERGTGLGLCVVYGIITRHGGDIDVRSVPGRGSVFTVRLPVQDPVCEAPPLAPAAPPRAARILAIDDEQGVRDIVMDLLRPDGHTVVVCADGESGMTRFEAEPFDLVITDLGMPGASGWDVAAFVKRARPETPVAMVTGWRDQLDEVEAVERGVDYLLTKPFKRDQLRGLIATALRREAAALESSPAR